MPGSPLTKSFHVYCSKLKRSITTTVHPHFIPTKHPYPPSKIKKSSSLNYDDDDDDDDLTSAAISNTNNIISSTSQDFASDIETTNIPPDFGTVFASPQRFFFTAPGRSNSIVESKLSNNKNKSIIIQEESAEDTLVINGGAIPIQTYSPNPFIDFRRSMQEMVEANDILVVRADNWKFLHELLFCYLALNTKNTHRFIVDAFVDLLVSLITTSSPPAPGDRCSTSYS